jgi:release factor glutamine methyltransferase
LYIRQLFREEKTLPRIDLTTIVAHVLDVRPEQVLMRPEQTLDEKQHRRIDNLIAERRRGKPVAYITRSKEFFSHEFFVDERVLIPRPETEMLVEEAIAFIKDRGSDCQVLDVGTGSGAIGLTLAAAGAEHVLCIDISPNAIDVARKNAQALGLEDRVSFTVCDLYSGIKEKKAFSVICANLPYVAADEYRFLDIDVRGFEPRGALVGGDDGLDFYRGLVQNVRRHLAPGGLLLCEIGDEQQAESLSCMLHGAGLATKIKKDLAGCQRVVSGLWISSL